MNFENLNHFVLCALLIIILTLIVLSKFAPKPTKNITHDTHQNTMSSEAAFAYLGTHPPGPTTNEVLQLQQRLKERTLQAMITCRRDAERIRALEERNRELMRMVDELRTRA